MPMPTPDSGEEKEKFIARFMGDAQMVADYPDNSQRYAIAIAQWDKSLGNNKSV